MIYSLRFSKKKTDTSKYGAGGVISVGNHKSGCPGPASECHPHPAVSLAIRGFRVELQQREREREREIHLAECWVLSAAMFVVNIQSSPASDQSCWTVASRGERVCQVWLWLVCWYLTWTVSSLVVIPRQSVHSLEHRRVTPRFEKRQKVVPCKTKWQYILA